eukprot:3506155-Rhodomonas_salina.1
MGVHTGVPMGHGRGLKVDEHASDDHDPEPSASSRLSLRQGRSPSLQAGAMSHEHCCFTSNHAVLRLRLAIPARQSLQVDASEQSRDASEQSRDASEQSRDASEQALDAGKRESECLQSLVASEQSLVASEQSLHASEHGSEIVDRLAAHLDR